MKRLFFALWPDERVRKSLAECPLRGTAGVVRPVHRDDVHMTLQFLGNVAESTIPALEQAAGAVEAPPFKITLTHVGCWPRPRIAWCAPDEAPAALARLVGELGKRLAPVGFPAERRPYRPHVTLARGVRSMPEARFSAPIVWTALEFVLVVSRAVPEPPRYQILARWALSAAPARE